MIFQVLKMRTYKCRDSHVFKMGNVYAISINFQFKIIFSFDFYMF